MIAAVVVGCWVAGSALGELVAVDRELNQLEQGLQVRAAQRERLLAEAAAVAAELGGSRSRRDEALVQFRKRLRALSRMPMGSRWALVAGAKSLPEYLEVQRVLRLLARHDRGLHDRYVAEGERLEQVETRLKAREAEVTQAMAEEAAVRDQVAQKRQARLEVVAKLLANPDSATRLAREADAAHANLLLAIRRLQPVGTLASDFARNRGRLPWPAAGKVLAGLGERLPGQRDAGAVQHGLAIAARSGDAVQSVAAGEVVFADWFEGYGQLVIVDHGRGFHTLYGHLARMLVSPGQQLDAGAAIGEVGDTGSLIGPQLYFELRDGGVPLDPQVWLRR